MKKVLIASTALVATAGVAAAEINMGGYVRAGVVYDQSLDNTANARQTRYETRYRLNIDPSATTDAGVRFSARARIQSNDNADGSVSGAAVSAPRFSAEAGGLRIDAGNAGGAIDNMPGYYGFEPGLTNFAGQYSGVSYSFSEFSSGGGNIDPTVYARYATGAFAGAFSYQQQRADADPNTDNEFQRTELHLAYTFGDFTAAVGYGSTSDAANGDSDMYLLTAEYSAGAFTVGGLVGSESFDNDATDAANGGTFYGLSGSYDVSPALTIGASYGDGNGDQDTQQFGLGAIYSLGGGVTIRGGVGSTKVGDGDSNTTADLGVRFNF